MDRLPLVVWSHLRWNSVFQRPHHLVTRLARRRPIVFIEEPVAASDGAESWELGFPDVNLVVATPRLRRGSGGFGPANDTALMGMARELLSRLGIERHAAWLYTPMAFRAARALIPEVVVYDCMDELSAFLGAPRGLVERERELLASADVVFAGGPSLYRAKRARNPHVFCFPSSVDAAHFARARNADVAHPAQRWLPRPRLGFFGVLDERLDRDVVAALASAHGDWQVVLIGPVLKIDEASLPRAANLHYLGQQPYAELPEHLAAWDMCLLPFARNESTAFISPTKTLEYMAAEKPIVTTAIRDVVDPYGTLIYVGDGPEAFVAACERALAESDTERARRVAGMRAVVEATSWETTAASMERELERAAWRRQPRRRPAVARAAGTQRGAL